MPTHLLRTKPLAEAAVVKEMLALEFPSFTPKERTRKVERGRVVEGLKALFPCHVFGEWESEDAHLWHRIRNLPGVTAILTRDELPVSVPVRALRALRQRLDADDALIVPPEEASRVRFGFGVGDLVRFTEGDWIGHVAICSWIDEKRGVRLKIAGQVREYEVFVPVQKALTGLVTARGLHDEVLRRRTRKRNHRGGKRFRNDQPGLSMSHGK